MMFRRYSSMHELHRPLPASKKSPSFSCSPIDCFLAVAQWIQNLQRHAAWKQMPERIILLRHGEAEHNLDHGQILQRDNPNRKPDNLCELTDLGRLQAYDAGNRIRELVGADATLSVVVSPFERTQQTLYCVQQALGPSVHVRCVHVDPRVREQEFGNFQVKDEMEMHRADAAEIGRFWYRRPQGESGADVYDRATTFWEDVFNGTLSPQFRFADSQKADDALVVVTHGLCMRVLCMRYFQWSPQTFDAVYNPGNCDTWVLRKDVERRQYEFAAAECAPPRLPWATRQVRVIKHGTQDALEGEPYTLLDYLALPQPRTSHPEEALKQLIAGHGHNLDPSRCGAGTPPLALDPSPWVHSIALGQRLACPQGADIRPRPTACCAYLLTHPPTCSLTSWPTPSAPTTSRMC